MIRVICVFLRVGEIECVYLIKAHLVRLLGRKRQEAGGLQGRVFYFQRKKRGEGYKENEKCGETGLFEIWFRDAQGIPGDFPSEPLI